MMEKVQDFRKILADEKKIVWAKSQTEKFHFGKCKIFLFGKCYIFLETLTPHKKNSCLRHCNACIWFSFQLFWYNCFKLLSAACSLPMYCSLTYSLLSIST